MTSSVRPSVVGTSSPKADVSLETDLLLDRRRLKRRLSFWRVAAVVLLVAAAKLPIEPRGAGGGTNIARLNIRGVIKLYQATEQ